jgi:hypothetical protein
MGMPPSPGNVLNVLPLPRLVRYDQGPTALLTSASRVEFDFPTPRPILNVARSSRKRLHQFSLGSSPATSPVGSLSTGFSRSFLATKSPRNRASFVVSPSRSPLKLTPRRVGGKISPIKKPVGRTESAENARPEQEDDSVTEPESEPEAHKPAQDDGSETEPESEMPPPVRLPIGIGKGVTQWPRATSPRASMLHSSASTKRSPYRKRRTPASYTSSLDDLMQDGAGMSVPSSRGSFMLPSSAAPAVARDFLDMFQGDGSYPDDFPESLRC